MTDPARRIDRLEAIDAIKRLKLAYARACDYLLSPREQTDLFTLDGVWDGGKDVGVHRGHAELLEFFTRSRVAIPWAAHYMVAPTIELTEDHRSATGRWMLWQPCVLMVDGVATPMIVAGEYEDAYSRVDAGWRIAHARLRLEAASPQLGGTAACRLLAVRP